MDIVIILSWLVVISFYTAYFIKMLLQRRRGIKTDQLASGGKPRKTYIIELILKVITYLTATVQVICLLLPDAFPALFHSTTINYLGIILSVCGLLVFILAMSTMRDNWRAGINTLCKTQMVTTGIYRFSRNPAFLGFDLFYLGFTLMIPNLAVLICSLCAAVLLHLQILEEERYLPALFGQEYLEYKKKTGRYF